jgi:hypothetical protein
MVYDHHRLFRERLTKGIKTGYHHTDVYGAFKHQWMQVVLAIHTPEHIDPPIFPGRQLDDALGLLPGRGHRGIKRKARFIKIVESDPPLILLCLQGGQCTLTAGTGLRITETLSRLSHPFPSKTCLCGQTCARRETEALLGFAGKTLHHRFERTGRFFDLLLRKGLFVWRKCAWSATARVIMQTLGAMMFPLLDPGRHGDSMDLRGLGNGLDGRTSGTQQQTMGAAPRSEGGILLHRFFSECTLLVGQRLHISHDHPLIRS